MNKKTLTPTQQNSSTPKFLEQFDHLSAYAVLSNKSNGNGLRKNQQQALLKNSRDEGQQIRQQIQRKQEMINFYNKELERRATRHQNKIDILKEKKQLQILKLKGMIEQQKIANQMLSNRENFPIHIQDPLIQKEKEEYNELLQYLQ